jgi:hypothetical protein
VARGVCEECIAAWLRAFMPVSCWLLPSPYYVHTFSTALFFEQLHIPGIVRTSACARVGECWCVFAQTIDPRVLYSLQWGAPGLGLDGSFGGDGDGEGGTSVDIVCVCVCVRERDRQTDRQSISLCGL